MEKEEFIKEVTQKRKTKEWYTFVGCVRGKSVRLKGYKTWLQIYHVDGVDYANNCDQSVKQFNQDLLKPFVRSGLN